MSDERSDERSDNEALLRSFFARVWNTGDVEAADDFLAPSYTIHSDPGDPWDGQTLDREGFKRRLAESRSPFPDLVFDLDEVVVAGDRVAVSWTMRGTHREAMGDLEATGRSIAVAGMTIYSFEDGRITGHRQVVDRLAVLAQLGILG